MNRNAIKQQAIAAGKKLGLAGTALALSVNQVMAAVPADITTALTTAGTDAATGITSNTSTGGTSSQNAFCTQNPDAPGCKPIIDECAKNPDLIQCATFGTPEALPDLQTLTLGVESVSPVSFATNSSCPAPIPLPHGATFSFQWLCDGMGLIRPLFLALAWLSAGMIVIGAARNG